MSVKVAQKKKYVFLNRSDSRRVTDAYLSGASSSEVAKMFSICESTVCKIVKRTGAQVRRDNNERIFTPIQEDDMVKLYSEWGLSINKLAPLYGVSVSQIYRKLMKLKVGMRSCTHHVKALAAGRKPTSWKGYTYVWNPSHPRSRGGYIFEHRLVAERYLQDTDPKNEALDQEGYLRGDWIVHHKNGRKSDNRVENLEPMHKSKHHSWLHYRHEMNELKKRISDLEHKLAAFAWPVSIEDFQNARN
jgi:hypothetical protein